MKRFIKITLATVAVLLIASGLALINDLQPLTILDAAGLSFILLGVHLS